MSMLSHSMLWTLIKSCSLFSSLGIGGDNLNDLYIIDYTYTSVICWIYLDYLGELNRSGLYYLKYPANLRKTKNNSAKVAGKLYKKTRRKLEKCSATLSKRKL